MTNTLWTKEYKKEYMRLWRLNNPQNVRKYGQRYKNWAEKNREVIRIRQRKWRQNNKEKTRARDKAYREANREKIRKIWLSWVSRNRDEFRKKRRQYVKRHRDDLVKVTARVKAKEIKSGPCIICGNGKTEKHHFNYSLPLKVIHLCRLHHADLHKRAKEDYGLFDTNEKVISLLSL